MMASKRLYETRVLAIGGRSGSVRSDDNLLNLPVALPRELGGPGHATNPEQLFAAGYASCFENAVLYIGKGKADLRAEDVRVWATVKVLDAAPGFKLAVRLETSIDGVSRAVAEELVTAAHAICPYSNAVRGNVEVELVVRDDEHTARAAAASSENL